MPELGPNQIYSSTARPEAPARPKESRIVTGVKKALNSWLERIGPRSVERHFIKAHETVLATLDSDKRKEVFAKEADAWQKAGKRWGVAATAIDSALIAYATVTSFIGLRDPFHPAQLFENMIADLYLDPVPSGVISRMIRGKALDMANHIGDFGEGYGYLLNVKHSKSLGRGIAAVPGIASVIFLAGSGPGHWLAHMAAGGKEALGKMNAKRHNYVDSGLAAEHAAKLGKGLESAGKYVAEHPDELRKTVESASRIKRQTEEHKQAMTEAKRKAEEEKLNADYQKWRQSQYEKDQAYYDRGGSQADLSYETFLRKKEEKPTKVHVKSHRTL